MFSAISRRLFSVQGVLPRGRQLFQPSGFSWLIMLLVLGSSGCFDQTNDITADSLAGDELMVAGLTPDSGELTLLQTMGVRFTGAGIIPDTTKTGSHELLPGSLSPKVKGIWQLMSANYIIFIPDEAYEPNTTYQLKLNPEYFAQAKVHLRGVKEFEFQAAPFSVQAINTRRLRLGGIPALHRITGSAHFNYPVDPEKFAEALRFSFEGDQPVNFIVETTAASKTINFRTEDVSSDRRDRTLKLFLDGGLSPVAGNVSLGETIEREEVIPAIERLKIENVSLGSQAEQPVVRINFSNRVLPEDLKTVLKVEPSVDGLRLVGHWDSIELVGNWEFDKSYKIKIAGSLVSESGLPLEKDFTRTITISDLDPMLRITGPGNYLSLHGEGLVGIETINLEKFNVSVERVFANNLVPFLQKIRLTNHQDYYYNWDLEDQGSPVFSEDILVPKGLPNKIQVTPVDLKDALREDSRGIFRLRVTDPDSYGRYDGRWIVATDLGLVAKQSGDRVEVAVASISKLQPVQGVKVQVMSLNNQVLASSRTNNEGLVSFTGLSWENAGGRPFVVVATKGSDLSFLAFDQTRIRTADLDVGGVDVSEKGYRAYLYGERDIYRPGETAHLVWVVRDSHLQPPTGFPLNLKIMGPSGQMFINAKVNCDATGTGDFTIDFPQWAMTGKYTALLFLGENDLLGETQISVEDFIPDRMKVGAEILVDGKRLAVLGPSDHANLQARAMTLFGPPAAARQAEASIWFRKARVEVPGYEEFTFGENLGEELPPRRDLGHQQTDRDGLAQWEMPLPKVADYQGWMRMTSLVKITELGGGRAVSTTAEAIFSPSEYLMGLRNLSREESDFMEPGQALNFEGVMVDISGVVQVDKGATVKVMRKQWRTVLKKDGQGKFHYISEYDEKPVQEFKVDLGNEPTAFKVTPNAHGDYRLVLESASGKVRGSISFYVYGYGYAPWAMSNPEKINFKLDRQSYGDGDVVTASVEAPFSGLMLLTVEREKVYSRRWITMDSNTTTVQVSLPSGLAPNVYLTATLLRSLDDLDPRAPARAFGAVPVLLDRAPVTLPLELSVSDKMRPNNTMNIRVHIAEDEAPVRFTVAAVDEGILQLTDYKTPSALDHFLQRRRLSVNSYDIWSLLLPEYEKVLRKSSTGGDGDLAMMAPPEQAKRLNPLAASRVKPVALWSGLLEGKSGWQNISFEVPEYNGALRVMVMAMAGNRFGSAETMVTVADPLVLSSSLPRFLAPGDKFRVPVPVYNGLPGAIDQLVTVNLGLTLDGPLKVSSGQPVTATLPVGIGREEVKWFDLEADQAIGIAQVKFTASAKGETVSQTTELAVRPPLPLDSRVETGTVNSGVAFNSKISGHWYPGTGITTIAVAANPAAQFGAALPYLLRYPYGCLEQITSRSFPLVYFGDLAQKLAPGEFAAGDADYFINSGLDYVNTLFRPGAGFFTWPGRNQANINAWATTYVTHFLVEAQSRGFVLPEDLLDGALSVVGRYARSSDSGWPSGWSRRHRLRTRAYACYVMALADRPDRGAMDQLAHGEWDNLSAASRTHLAGSYALTGNQKRFDELLPAVDAPVDESRSTGYSWYSLARDEAMRLDVLATVAPEHAQVPRLMQRLGRRAENGRWYNTQENAFALLALGKLSSSGMLDAASGQILVDGVVVAEFADEGITVQSREWAGKTVEIKTTSSGSAWFTVLDEGIPRKPRHEQLDAGLVVRREYLNIAGEPVDPMNLVQGQTIVCRILLTSNVGRVKDVVISDLVPAGLEIENPRLSRDGGYPWINQDQARYDGRLAVENLDIRDDRLLLFTSANSKKLSFYYSLRAVTAGEFTWPQVRAEAMYDPEVMSVRGGGEIRIVSP